MKKKIFLLFFLWIILGATMAQDIYTSGYFINPSGQKVAAVFKNDVIIYRRDGEGKDLYSSSMAIDTLTDDIYWVSNSNPVGDIANGYGCVMKNDEVLLDNELGTCINSISFDGNDLYAAGFYNDYYESVGAVWKNGEPTPLYIYGETARRSEILGVVAVDGTVYACGYYSNGVNYGCVWVNGDLYACYPYQKVVDITYSDGDIYYLVEDSQTTVYKSGQEFCSLHTNSNYTMAAYDIKVAEGDVYTVGFMGFNDCCVWKNSEIIYLHPYARNADFRACQFFGQSLYYVGWDHEDHGLVFKDGEQIADPRSQYYYDIYVRPSMLDVDDVQTEQITVFPNPAKDRITIKGLDHSEIANIFNATGQLVMTVTGEEGNEIDVSDLPAGLYLVHCGNRVLRFVKDYPHY